MGPRILDEAMTDQDFEALQKKLLETFSVRPTLLNPMVKSRVDWHCLKRSCLLEELVFSKRENWMRHHQCCHNRKCGSDRDYPKEIEAKQFIQEYGRRRENARRHGIAGAGGSAGSLMPPTATAAGPYPRISGAGAGGSAGSLMPPTATPAGPYPRISGAGAGGSAGSLMPPTATPAGPYPRISGVLYAIPRNSIAPSSSTYGSLRAIPLNSAAPSSSTSGDLRGASPNSAAPNSPRSRALRNSVAARRQGPYHPRAIKAAAARRQEHHDQGFVSIAGALQDKPESSRALDATKREKLMQQLSYNLQAVSRINNDSLYIMMQILGLPSTQPSTQIPRPAERRESPIAGAHGYPATTVATPVPLPNWVNMNAGGLQAGHTKFVDPAHSNEGPAHVFQTPQHVLKVTPHPSLAPAHSTDVPAHVYEATPHPSQALATALPIRGQANSDKGPPLSIGRPPHPHQAPALSIQGPRHQALPSTTPIQSEEKEEEENHKEASDSEETDSDNEDQPPIYRSQDGSEVRPLSSMPSV